MSARLHDDEVPVDAALVAGLVRRQLPEWASLPIVQHDAQGTDNVVMRLGDELSVRLPRKASAVPSLEAELTWLPRLGPLLPLAVPTPVSAGEPDLDYPFPWSVCRWLDGTPPDPASLDPATPTVLGAFVAVLEGIGTEGAPVADATTNRGGSLGAFDEITRTSLDRVVTLMAAGVLESDLLDPVHAEAIWEAATTAPSWAGPGVWLHRDLHPDNLLAVGGTLTGVIDFGGLVVGDPAGNALGAWHLFDAAGRRRFRETIRADDATWTRARGWALSQGLLALPYYIDTHPGMVTMARRVIRAALESDGDD